MSVSLWVLTPVKKLSTCGFSALSGLSFQPKTNPREKPTRKDACLHPPLKFRDWYTSPTGIFVGKEVTTWKTILNIKSPGSREMYLFSFSEASCFTPSKNTSSTGFNSPWSLGRIMPAAVFLRWELKAPRAHRSSAGHPCFSYCVVLLCSCFTCSFCKCIFWD